MRTYLFFTLTVALVALPEPRADKDVMEMKLLKSQMDRVTASSASPIWTLQQAASYLSAGNDNYSNEKLRLMAAASCCGQIISPETTPLWKAKFSLLLFRTQHLAPEKWNNPIDFATPKTFADGK